MMKQSDAVVLAVRATFSNHDGAIPATTSWSDAQSNEVYATLLKMFKEGSWTKQSGGTDDASVMKYIPGLVNNHVRKDTRLNGGTKYETKRPGSRAGSGDESIKAMRTLLSVTSDPQLKSQIQTAIDARIEELKPKATVNVEALPEALRHLVQS